MLALPDQPIVLIDDIISSGHTMLESIKSLKQSGYKNIYCLAIHGIFANQIDQTLITEGAIKIVTTNSINHTSNSIDLSELLAAEVAKYIGETEWISHFMVLRELWQGQNT